MTGRHCLRHELEVDAPPESVVPFFHDMRNLLGSVPRFPRILLEGESFLVRAGASLTVTVDLLVTQLRWSLTILESAGDGRFVDSLTGPLFAEWKHSHIFVRTAKGTRIIDEVNFVPSGWLAPITPLVVRLAWAVRGRVLTGSLRRAFVRDSLS